jgi:chemotaxis protein methyltransferase CheR
VSARVLTHGHVDRLRGAVARGLGLHFDDGKLELLASVMEERLDALREAHPDRWLRGVEDPAGSAELRALAERLTVGETYFFRNEHDLAAFTGTVLPERMRARAGTRRLRILSAGCSSGEEPYTLAMLALREPRLAGWEVSIHGVDVNPAAIARATAGRYTQWALRQTPADVRERFFRRAGRELVLDAAVRRMVTFEERNLAASDGTFWRADAWDVVFCRNVTMYLVPEAARALIDRIARSLSPGGCLFLGHAETLRGLSTAFHLRHAADTFYYQLREGAVDAPAAAAPPAAEPPAPLPDLDGSASWVEAIRVASERVARLAGSQADGAGPPAGSEPAVAAASAGGLARALDLVRRERYADALRAIPPADGGPRADPDVLLLRAALLAITGAAPEAEGACREILARDELNAEAHYVMALCREHAGDRAGAANHDQYAIYLDAAFAMPRLHLGLMARRAGDVEAARRDLGRASVLLAYEDTSRILLLGGGFSRDALLDVCRRELRACGGLP